MRNAQDMHECGKSKVDAYGWTIKDKPGQPMMIDKRFINVDPTYQREAASNARILRIASEWSWIACNSLTLARRPDGTLWAIDGQYRKLAADKRSDIIDLPCLVFDVTSIEEEAAGFISANTVRGPVKASEKFKAACVKGDKICLEVKAMIEAQGYSIGAAKSFGIGCIGAVLGGYQIDKEVAIRAWKVCCDVHAGDRIDEKLWGGLFYLERFLKIQKDSVNRSLTQPHNLSVLLESGRQGLLTRINQAAAFYAKGGPKIFACGIANALNHKRRSRRIQISVEVGNSANNTESAPMDAELISA